jgi:hypothetical protein
VDNVRATGATRVRTCLAANKGPSQAGAHFPQVFPGADRCDVVGIDQYDMWGPSFDADDWADQLAPGTYPNARYVADFAAANKVMWSWDEGGNTHPADGDHGGDNPYYWQARWEFIQSKLDRLAWDNTYLHSGAPSSLRHDFASNPRSWDVYRAPGRWGGVVS